MSIESLIHYFNNKIDLTPEEINFVKTNFQARTIKRRQFILQEGDICKFNTFVVEGCLKLYKVDEHGKEHNLQFALEDSWVGDLESFYKETPSQLYIEALEKSTVLQITQKKQIELYLSYPKFDRIFRVLAENAMIAYQHRVLQNISSTAEERYTAFLKKSPQLLNRISNVQIASYIGVTPEFLSTIRKKITLA